VSGADSSLAMHGHVVLSADVVGSTALYDVLGDTAARSAVAAALDILRACTAENRGRVIAEVGDQIIALFDDASAAAGTASELHARLHDAARAGAAPALSMRVGLHHGPVPPGIAALSGETIKIAQWASGNAKPEQTLATRALIDQLPRVFRAVSRYVDDETWNFISQAHVELYEIIWDVEAITAYNGEKPTRDAAAYGEVVFEYGAQQVSVASARPVISIGRDAVNDLVVPRDLVSRQHLSAQFSRGRCTITDNSTNGSLVVQDDGTRYELKRESLRLSGSGHIVLGKPLADEAAFTVRYRCR